MTSVGITAMQTAFTDAITSMGPPVIAILSAVIGISVIFVMFKLGQKAFKGSKSA